MRRLPYWLTTAPCELYIAWLAGVKGLPAALSFHTQINGPESAYPRWLIVVWGTELTVAGVMLAWGIIRRRSDLRFAAFAVLSLATAMNLVGIVSEFSIYRPAYELLYFGFFLMCLLKMVSILRSEAFVSKVYAQSSITDADPPTI